MFISRSSAVTLAVGAAVGGITASVPATILCGSSYLFFGLLSGEPNVERKMAIGTMECVATASTYGAMFGTAVAAVALTILNCCRR